MRKELKLLIYLLLILIIILLALILTSGKAKPAEPLPAQSVQPRPENIIMSDEAYQREVKEILSAYEEKISADQPIIGEISEVKNRLLALKGIQAKYQKLHLEFALAIAKMESYLLSGNEAEKNESQQTISRLKEENGWLKD